MTLRSSDLQSDRDLDSIRNSCNVFSDQEHIFSLPLYHNFYETIILFFRTVLHLNIDIACVHASPKELVPNGLRVDVPLLIHLPLSLLYHYIIIIIIIILSLLSLLSLLLSKCAVLELRAPLKPLLFIMIRSLHFGCKQLLFENNRKNYDKIRELFICFPQKRHTKCFKKLTGNARGVNEERNCVFLQEKNPI